MQCRKDLPGDIYLSAQMKADDQAKAEALEARGVRVGKNPTEVAQIAAETAGTRA